MNPLGRWLLIGCALVAGSGCRTVPLLGAWSALATEPYPGKQDDIFFLNEQLGWYVNGEGNIYKTSDGGRSWTRKLQKPGTYFRSVGFVDASHGYAGNLGPGYFEGVTDSVLLYETWDGGETWAPAKDFPFPAGAGVCSIDILHAPSGQAFVHVAGRVGGPAFLARSTDGGAHWVLVDLRPLTAMILDVHFVDPDTGFIAGASDADAEKSHARVLKTTNGGQSWTSVYESTRPFEITWKESFPTAEVGYVTVQNYNPDAAVSRRLVAKTQDGGKSWQELPLADDHAQQEFGIGFATPEVGWVGTTRGGYQTTDGGKTWTWVDMGRVVNKIRVVPTAKGFAAFAIGKFVYRLDTPAR